MILSNNGVGIGTSQNKKQRGNRNSRATRLPKHKIKDPTHQITIASMLRDSCTSASEVREKPPTRIATIRRDQPSPRAGSVAGFNNSRSEKIKDALIGRIKSRWVYSSLCSASARALSNARQPTNSGTADRNANRKDGDIPDNVPRPVEMGVVKTSLRHMQANRLPRGLAHMHGFSTMVTQRRGWSAKLPQ